MSIEDNPRQMPTTRVSHVTGSTLIIGHNNRVVANIRFEQFKDDVNNADPELWKEITAKMDELLKAVKGLSDEYEDVRDIDLTPAVSSAKKEAAAISIDPKKSKNSFVDQFKTVCDLASKVVDVGTKLAPFIVTIGKLLGIA